jgi:hypothetical protein
MPVNNHAPTGKWEDFERTEGESNDKTDFGVVDAVVMAVLDTKSIDKWR